MREPRGVSRATLLQFEKEFGEFIEIPKMEIETIRGTMNIPGGQYIITESLHRLNLHSSTLLPPSECSPFEMDVLRKTYVKAKAVVATNRLQAAKDRLTEQAKAGIPPTESQKQFIASLRSEAERLREEYSELLRPLHRAKEEQERKLNERKMAVVTAIREVEKL